MKTITLTIVILMFCALGASAQNKAPQDSTKAKESVKQEVSTHLFTWRKDTASSHSPIYDPIYKGYPVDPSGILDINTEGKSK